MLLLVRLALLVAWSCLMTTHAFIPILSTERNFVPSSWNAVVASSDGDKSARAINHLRGGSGGGDVRGEDAARRYARPHYSSKQHYHKTELSIDPAKIILKCKIQEPLEHVVWVRTKCPAGVGGYDDHDVLVAEGATPIDKTLYDVRILGGNSSITSELLLRKPLDPATAGVFRCEAWPHGGGGPPYGQVVAHDEYIIGGKQLLTSCFGGWDPHDESFAKTAKHRSNQHESRYNQSDYHRPSSSNTVEEESSPPQSADTAHSYRTRPSTYARPSSRLPQPSQSRFDYQMMETSNSEKSQDYRTQDDEFYDHPYQFDTNPVPPAAETSENAQPKHNHNSQFYDNERPKNNPTRYNNEETSRYEYRHASQEVKTPPLPQRNPYKYHHNADSSAGIESIIPRYPNTQNARLQFTTTESPNMLTTELPLTTSSTLYQDAVRSNPQYNRPPPPSSKYQYNNNPSAQSVQQTTPRYHYVNPETSEVETLTRKPPQYISTRLQFTTTEKSTTEFPSSASYLPPRSYIVPTTPQSAITNRKSSPSDPQPFIPSFQFPTYLAYRSAQDRMAEEEEEEEKKEMSGLKQQSPLPYDPPLEIKETSPKVTTPKSHSSGFTRQANETTWDIDDLMRKYPFARVQSRASKAVYGWQRGENGSVVRMLEDVTTMAPAIVIVTPNSTQLL